MKDEIKEIINQLEIVARKHTIEVCEDGSKIETMPASVVDELRLNNYSSKILLDYITNLQEKLKVSQTNEKTYRLEMQDITKILGLEEHTTFDEVKEYATNLQEEKDKFKEYAKNYLKSKIDRKNEELEFVKTKFIEEHNKCYDYKSRNEKAKSLTNRTIEIIKQQPSGNDEWILERLNGINYCLGGDEE